MLMRFPLVEDRVRDMVKMMRRKDTHANHRMAELPSAFREISTASSSATGNSVTEAAPIRAISANRAPVLSGLAVPFIPLSNLQVQCKMWNVPAQMRLSQSTPRVGHKNLHVSPRWFVRTRSNNGDVTAAQTRPARRSVAPIRPEMSLE